ncbi:unnamed protein product [Rhizophagus irregularis]|nr:unnamed protein product [Rhizophagus irregularis]
MVYKELVKEIEVGCKVLPPNVVILEPGENPCNNEAVHNACSMYFSDVFPKNGANINIDLACDEAIFRRLISYREQRPEIRLMLGAWHTNILIRNDRAIKSRKEALWNLVNKLTDAFSLVDPTTHDIFKNTTENNTEGFNNLFNCYVTGIERINDIYAQEIEKSVPYNTKGRRKKNIKTITVEQQRKVEKNCKEQERIVKRQRLQENNIDINKGLESPNNNPKKRKYRTLSNSEQEIFTRLRQLTELSIEETEKVHIEICSLPNSKPEEWDIKRIREVWLRYKRQIRKKAKYM